jgi:hypothetical protein
MEGKRKAYGDPRRPQSVTLTQTRERERLASWLERFAHVRLRQPEVFGAVDQKVAHVILQLADQMRYEPGGDLIDPAELSRLVRLRFMRSEYNRRWREHVAERNGNH